MSYNDDLNNLKSEVQNASNISINKNTLIYGLINGFAKFLNLIKRKIDFDFKKKFLFEYQDLTELKSTGDIIGIQYNLATSARGFAIIQGTEGIGINADIEFTNGTYNYKTIGIQSTSSNQYNLLSLVASAGIATAKTQLSHNFASGQIVSISGANQSDFNLSNVKITVISSDEFTYQITNMSSLTGTGTILCSTTFALIELLCLSTGSLTNLTNGYSLTIVSPITNLDNFCLVNYNGLSNGVDDESRASYQSRVSTKFQNNTYSFTTALLESTLIAKFPEIAQVSIQNNYSYPVKVISIRKLTTQEKTNYPDYSNDLFRVVETDGPHRISSHNSLGVKITGSTESSLNIPTGLSQFGNVYLVLDIDKIIIYVGNNTVEDLTCSNVILQPKEDTNCLFILNNTVSKTPSNTDLDRYLAFIDEEIFPYADYVYGFLPLNISFEISGLDPFNVFLEQEIINNLNYYFKVLRAGTSVSKKQYENVVFRSKYQDISVINFQIVCKLNGSPITDIAVQPYQFIQITSILFL